MSKVEAAVAWARRGYRVFPCHADEPGRNGNARRAKKPMWEGWTSWASSDEATIRSWWGTNEFNIGVLTTDLVVVDIDMKRDRDGMASWFALYGGFDTLAVRSPSGGLHLYYTGANVALNQGALGAGLDIRSHHGYVLAPGSTIDGVPYRVEIDQPMTQAPAVVIAKCKPPGERAANAQETLVDEDDARGIALAVQAIAATPAAIEGERSEAAYKLACKVRDFGISEVMCRSLMAAWGASSSVVGDDLHTRIGNAYAYAQNASGARHPDVLFSGINVPEPPPDLLPPEAVAVERGAVVARGVRLLSPADCADVPPTGYVVKHMIAPRQHCCIFGLPGAGKSVLAPHLAYAVAQGRPVFGQRTKAGPVLYVCGEDETGMQRRITALRERHGDAPNFRLVVGLPSLLDPASGGLAALQHIVEEHRPVLIVVDTLAAVFPGLQENEPAAMGGAVAALRSLTRHGAAVVTVHHSSKTGDTPRGHSVLNGDLDFSVRVVKDDSADGLVVGHMQKNRLAPCDSSTIAFRIEGVPLGRDEDGDLISAPVCTPRTEEEARADRKANLTKQEAAAEAIIVEMGGQEREVPMDELMLRACEFGAINKTKDDANRKLRVKEVIKRLHDKKRIWIGKAGGVEAVRYMGHGYERMGDKPKPWEPPANLFLPRVVLPPPAPVPSMAEMLS